MRSIVLLDIDGTLVDPKYRINSNTIFKLIKKCESQGTIFALNSNRSLNDLLPVYKRFGLDGFIIGENGAFVFRSKGKSKVYASKSGIQKIRQKLPLILKSNFKNSTLLFKDTVMFLQKPERTNASVVFLANKFRKYTMSIFIGKVSSGKFVKNTTLALKATKIIKSEIKKLAIDYSVTYSKIFGNVLILPKKCSKSSTLNKLVKDSYKKYPTIMISDDEPIQLINSVDKFYAVGNASIETKRHSDYVSKYNYTKGVEEILKSKILDKSS